MRMKEALIKLHDVSNCEKQENWQLQKQTHTEKSEILLLTKVREKLQKKLR